MANRNPQNQDKLVRGGPGRPVGSKNKLTVERVELELARIALADPLQLFEGSRPRGKKGVRLIFRLRDIHEMPPEIRACIASIKVRKENLTAGDDRQDETVEIRLWDKVKALELCARHFKWIEDKLKIEINVGELEARLREGQRRNALRAAGALALEAGQAAAIDVDAVSKP